MRASSVLCGQLKCGSAVAVLGSDWFGEGSGRIWADVFDCEGNETHLSKCPISSWSRTACSHQQDAGVICSGSSLALHEGRVRLSGRMECEGEVEVYIKQDWRRVLLDSWSESVASVVCRQLGCGSVFSFSSSSPSSPEHSHMCVTGFNCSGSEAHLGNCSSAQAVNCSSREQLSVSCSAHSSIRLVGSGGDCAGRLEVFNRGSWGTVCDDLWAIEDAQVVCRQLQCGVALEAPVPAQFGPGTGPIWLNEVECEGNETSLWNCRFQLSGKDECAHKEDVGVVCSEYKEIRLTEGCEGNLEVFYNGTWGNVCVNGMNQEAVKLICQHLNCGRSGRESWSKARVGSAPNWLDNLKCRKHDSTLWHCPSSPWGQNGCDNRSEVARITCSGGQIEKTTTCPQPLSIATPAIYPVPLLVLGVLLFLALVLLFVLLYQNRRLRRVLSKKRCKTLTEAVYEEIDHRFIPQLTAISAERAKAMKEKTACSDDDTADFGLTGELETEDTPDCYDDVMTAGQTPGNAEKGVVETYDDVIASGHITPGSVPSEGQHSRYEDVDEELLLGLVDTEDTSENYDDVCPAVRTPDSVNLL
ncbi:hypothetical protein NFI96_015819, partial [Prochilodus magdalenae]